MNILEQRILKDGIVIGNEILKVDSFLNHQMDIKLFNEMGKEFKKRFKEEKITKILTIEASGIGIACVASQYFDYVPVVFGKKNEASNMDKDTFEAEVYSFTKNKSYKVRVSKKFINKEDKILIIDDFLANGNAVLGLMNIVNQAGAETVGVGIAIEKGFQQGRSIIEKTGVKLESIAVIDSMNNGNIKFK